MTSDKTCRFCHAVEPMQVRGGGRYATAHIDAISGRLTISDGRGLSVSVKIRHCPMCGRKLIGVT